MKKHPVLFGFLIFSAVALLFYAFIFGMFSLLGRAKKSDSFALFEPSVGVIEINGVIESSDRIAKSIREFVEDDQIKGILVRIDSPGGMVAPVQEIHRELLRAREAKPVFASLGGAAASGGYYIACAAETIVSNPGTMTGSIGVIMEFISGEKAFQMLGLTNQVVKSGKFKDTGNIARGLSEDERRVLQETVDDVFRQFVDAVSEGRNLDQESVLKVADGRVLSGAQAKDVGLVDELGSFYDTLDLLKEKLRVEGKVRLIYPKEPESNLFEYLINGISGRIKDALIKESNVTPTGRLFFR